MWEFKISQNFIHLIHVKETSLNEGRRNEEIKLIEKMLSELFHQGTRKSEHYGKK